MDKRKKINSIGLAIFLCANALTMIYPTNNIIVIISLISLLIVFLNNPLPVFLNTKLVAVVLVILLFLFTSIFANYNADDFYLYFYSFLVFGVVGILYSNVPIDYPYFYRTTILIAILSMPGIIALDTRSYTNMKEATGSWMSASQNSLRLILGLILALSFVKNKIYKMLVVLIIMFYFSFYFNYGTRGAFLSLLVFLFFIFLERKKRLNLKTISFLFLGIGFLSFFLQDIMIFIQQTLFNYGYSIRALDKSITVFKSDIDVSNGRYDIWLKAFNEIVEKPIFGNGIASFTATTDTYVHNVFITILHEGGVLYFLPILFVFLKFIKLLLSKTYPSQQKEFLIYLFCAGIIELMFSNVYWRTMMFWYFVGYVLSAELNQKCNETTKLTPKLIKVN